MKQFIDGDFLVTEYDSGAVARELRFVPEPAAPRVLTKTQYMARFTDAELAGIYSAAKSVVLIEVWLERFRAATEIDLDYGPTAAGVAALEAAGLLAPGRAAEILA